MCSSSSIKTPVGGSHNQSQAPGSRALGHSTIAKDVLYCTMMIVPFLKVIWILQSVRYGNRKVCSLVGCRGNLFSLRHLLWCAQLAVLRAVTVQIYDSQQRHQYANLGFIYCAAATTAVSCVLTAAAEISGVAIWLCFAWQECICCVRWCCQT